MSAQDHITTPENLMKALDFTIDDIRANRRRQLSERQRRRLRRLQGRAVLIGGAVFLLLAFTASLLIYLGQRGQQPLLSALGVLTTVLNAITIGFSARSFYRLEADLRAAEPLEIYEGIVERVIRPYGRVNNYVLRLADQEFSVTREVFNQFRHREGYAIYATQHSNLIMSSEWYYAVLYQ
jgi:hypothetical protein